MERIFEFPLPYEWAAFEEYEGINHAQCVCYQYDVDANGYGPYGFLTDKAKKILDEVLANVFFFDRTNNSLRKTNSTGQNGLYVYGNNSAICHLEDTALLNIYDEDRINAAGIQDILAAGYGCFASKFVMPEAGQTLIFFVDDVLDAMRESAKRHCVDYYCVNSINLLKSW